MGRKSGIRGVLKSAAFCITLLYGLLCTTAAQANTLIFTYADNNGIDVQARFDINTTAKTITVYLLNLQNNPSDITQVLGSVRFNVTGAGATPIPTITSSSFSTFAIDSTTGAPTTDTTTPVAWTASNVSGTQLALCKVCANGAGGSNNDMIIGGPNSNGVYVGANGKTQGGLVSHSPFIIGSGATYSTGALAGLNTTPDWVLSIPTITAGQTIKITNVIFGFGTGTNFGTATDTVQFDDSVPEPESNILMATGIGLVLLAGLARRYRRSRS